MLSAVDVKIVDLVLDPNNPRFIKDFTESKRVPEDKLEDTEAETLKCFSINPPSSDDDATNSNDLFESMKNIGYVPIDRVVVRKIKGSEKYLVIEGNRRISTVKKLLAMLDSGDDAASLGKRYGENKELLEAHRQTFETIPCKLLETEGLSDDVVSHRISVILGLRHHGSLLEWEPLPRAYNIYNEYMNIDGTASAEFRAENSKIMDVSARLSIGKPKVISALKTYIAYLQLSDANPSLKDRHYSLIEAAVNSRPLLTYYWNTDKMTYRLDDDSIERMSQLCQFGERDNVAFEKRKIIKDPKAMNRFGLLIKKQHEQDHAETTSYITSQVEQLLDEENTMTLEEALDNVTSYINRTKWVDAVDVLLAQRAKKLDFTEYTGTSNDLAAKESLKFTLTRLLKVID